MRGSGSAVPVTLLSGFLGSGKTTLLKHILESRDHAMRVAVIVNDMASLNIDAQLLHNSSLLQVEERMIEMQNGCICCTLREDLLVEIKRLAQSGACDYVIIEPTGIAEPLQIAETFTFEDGGETLSKWARLDNIVTLVDVAHFFQFVGSQESVGEGTQDWRSLAALLIEQIEFCNVVIVNKCDLVDEATAAKVEHAVRALNPHAVVLRKKKGDAIDLRLLLNTGHFDFEKAAQNPAWLQVMRGAPHTPESEEYGVSSFIYRARRPFHDGRLFELLERSRKGSDAAMARVLRSKGVCWLASQQLMRLTWSSAGWSYSIEDDRPWPAAVPREAWEDTSEFLGLYGDRRQEFVVIGLHLDEIAVRAALDACLLNDDEFVNGWELRFAAKQKEKKKPKDKKKKKKSKEGKKNKK